MKIPKTIKKFCPHCKKHTEQKVSLAKKKTAFSTHPLAGYGKKRAHFGKGFGNLGRYGSKPAISKFKMTGKKQTKKTDVRFTCSVCQKATVENDSRRTKKLNIV